MNPKTPAELAAEEQAAAAARITHTMGFCPECGCDFLSGFEHTDDCPVRAEPAYRVHENMLPPPKVGLDVIRLTKRGQTHLHRPGSVATACADRVPYGERFVAPPGTEVRCYRCRWAAGMPRLPRKSGSR